MDRKALANPFDNDVVIDPGSHPETDVSAIHKASFLACQTAFNRVASENRSRSVLIYGEAGCGKTHLLSRFRKWLAGEMDGKPKVAGSIFIAVRMETGPRHVWRHLRRRLFEELLRRNSNGLTQLDSLLSRHSSSHQSLGNAFDDAPVRDLGHDLMQVLERFAVGQQRRLCRAWLMGDGISEADAQLLNLPAPGVEELDEDRAEYDARRTVLAITRLCAPVPVVFCFDQIEALSLSEENKSFGAFSRMVASLMDEVETGNSLVVSTVLASFLQSLQDGSSTSDFQRLGKDRADLQPLNWDQGLELLQSRLSLLPELESENPLPEPDLRALYGMLHGRVTPRRLIHEARRLFERWQGQAERAPVSTEEFLRSEFEQFWDEAEVSRETGFSDTVLAQGLPVAFQLLGQKLMDNPPRHVDLASDSDNKKILIAFGNHSHMTSFAKWLQKIQEQPSPSAPVYVIRDERLPIPPTALKVNQRLQEITRSGGRLVRVDVEALAALDAMRRLLARATSGDLSLDANTVSPQTVREWLAKNLPQAVRNLTDEILGEGTKDLDQQPDALLELLSKRKVLPMKEAARLSGLPGEQIENYARTHPNRIALFGGACPVVCQALAQATEPEAGNAA